MKTPTQNYVSVEDISRLMSQIAPAELAEDWDNCGLQVGSLQWQVKKIWVALDPLLPVIEAAAQQNVDMVITHHPLIFRGLKSVDLETFEGKIISTALKHHIAVYAAHTNLDSVSEGVNDVLARKIGLQNIRSFKDTGTKSNAEGVTVGELALTGIGRIGELAPARTVSRWVDEIKEALGLEYVKVGGPSDKKVRRVAVCSGSGGSLIEDFLTSDADVFVSGDLRYHDARAVEDAGRAIIDVGHFASEHIILDVLAEKLEIAVDEAGWDVSVESCKIERDPFQWF